MTIWTVPSIPPEIRVEPARRTGPATCSYPRSQPYGDAHRIAKTRDNGVVPIASRGLVDQGKIKVGVDRAKRALQPDVVRIMYGFTLDWTDEQSLFFRIIISDAAAAPNRLRETTQRIRRKILTEIKADELGLQTYFNFRSQSEQAKLKEPAWEP